MTAARSIFEGRVSGSRGTTSDHYKRFAKLGVPGYKLESQAVEPPDDLAHIMTWHWDLRRRQLRGQEFEPVSMEAILAFKILFEVDMTPFDADMISRVDDIWQDVQPRPDAPSRPPPPLGRPPARRGMRP